MLARCTETYAFGWVAPGWGEPGPRAEAAAAPDARAEAWDHVLRGWDMALKPNEKRAILPAPAFLRRRAGLLALWAP